MGQVEDALRYLRRWQSDEARQLAETLARVAPGGPVPEELRLSLAGAKRRMPISPVLDENTGILRLIMGPSPDVVFRAFEIGADAHRGSIFLIDNLVKKDYIMGLLEVLVVRLRQEELPSQGQALQHFLEQRALTNHEVNRNDNMGELVEAALSGDSILLLDGLTVGLGVSTRGWEHRQPAEPVAEPVVRGPKEGFTETLAVNLALIRRRVKDERLRVEHRRIGTHTGTDILMIHLAGLATPEVVAEVGRRLDRIQIDGVLESGYLEELIEDHPFSPFPQVRATERPDVVAADLLEGRVAVLTDGTPHVLLMPHTFTGAMQAAEDYYQRWPMASFLRSLRYLFLLVALLGPSTYIAMTTFHHEMIPTSLLIGLMAAREGVPFPALVEALMMEFTFEALREAGVRLPKPVGQAISIVGALVIGESAVRAGLISPVMVIVVSITAIASFVIPFFSMGLAIRLLRFGMMLLAGTLGFYGLVIGLLAVAIHLASLRSFGVPYLTPIMPPTAEDMKDLMIRAPWWFMRRRPREFPVGNRVRQRQNAGPQTPGKGGGP